MFKFNFRFKKPPVKTFEKCPACGSDQLELLELRMVGDAQVNVLMPVSHQLKFFRASHGVPLSGTGFQMCMDCGVLFRQEAPHLLRQYLNKYVKR